MKSFKTDICLYRDKQENDSIVRQAKELGFSDEVLETLKYLGYEVYLELEISETGVKILNPVHLT